MRRKDKQINDPNIISEILSNAYVCRIAFVDGDKPYLVPMNYVYKDNVFYLHSALEGRKIDLIKKNNNVCVEVTDSVEIMKSDKACGYTTRYRSVIFEGTIHFITELEEKVYALKLLMKQHTGTDEWEIPKSPINRVLILKVNIDSITGKMSRIED